MCCRLNPNSTHYTIRFVGGRAERPRGSITYCLFDVMRTIQTLNGQFVLQLESIANIAEIKEKQNRYVSG